MAGRYRQAVLHRDGWLFPGQHALKPISTRQLYRVVVGAAQAAEITRRVGPHTLRHRFATHLLEDGHRKNRQTKDPSITDRYARVVAAS